MTTGTELARIVVAAIVAAVVFVGCAESGPERWEERGFDSEAGCWLNHGWDGSVSDGANRHELFDWWCGPIEDD